MNLKNLAQTLGISETTVSRALNGYPEVSEKTRMRVLAAAKAAGYRPNPVARSLAVGRTNVIGIVYPLLPADLGDPMFLDFVGGMSSALESRGMNLVIAPSSSANELRSYDHIVKGKRVDGLIVSRTKVHDERIAFLAKHGWPFIAHGRTSSDAPYAWFDYDNEAGIRIAMDELFALGHQRIGFISAPLEMNCAMQRLDSFKKRIRSAGLQIDPRHLIADALDRRSGYQAMQKLLHCSSRPTAVIVENHLAGIGAMRALMDAGIGVGRDISIIIWGSLADSLVSHQVATIEQPEQKQAGVKVIEMLLALLDGTSPSELQVLWQPVFKPGNTIGRRPH